MRGAVRDVMGTVHSDTLPRVSAGAPVLVVTGLRFEAKIAAGAGVHVVCQQNTALEAALATALDHTLMSGCRGIVSFGTAGGLVDALRPGAWVVARAVLADDRRYACDPAWTDTLRRALGVARDDDIAGSGQPAVDAQAKRALQRATGAAAVDMESQVVARIAVARGIPFVCCRVVIDPVERSLPAAALAAMREDGSTDVLAVLRSLIRRPAQLPALLDVARDAGVAKRALRQGRLRLGERFGMDATI
jgi:hopanoid-associated phosphorylase